MFEGAVQENKRSHLAGRSLLLLGRTIDEVDGNVDGSVDVIMGHVVSIGETGKNGDGGVGEGAIRAGAHQHVGCVDIAVVGDSPAELNQEIFKTWRMETLGNC